jgi:hypothetical protein
VTVMIDRFFGLPQQIVKSGLWKKMLPGEKDLYIFLMEESERCCTRQMCCTDAQITKSVGVSKRTLCNARKKLQERGLISCARHQGNKYMYTICDPATGKPYPGDPKLKIEYVKQSAEKPTEPPRVPSRPANQPPAGQGLGQDSGFHGVPLAWSD